MIDLKYLRDNFNEASQKLLKRGVDKELLEKIKTLFEKLKEAIYQFETKRAEQKAISKEFGIFKRENKDTSSLEKKLSALKEEVNKAQIKVKEIEDELNNLVATIPNFPDDDVPYGEGEEDNVVIKEILSPTQFDFKPKEHWELAQENGWIDFQRGVKLAKSRFSLLRKEAARIERALINFFLDENIKAGFEEVSPPFLNNSKMLFGTGQLPKFEDDLFKVCDEDLYLIPTAEVPLTNIYNDEILKEKDLPILLTAYTPCFRKEAGSAGKDTRGMIRQHQFDKVEMVAISTPQKSDEIFNFFVEHASNLLTKLELPHRLVMLCTKDLGFSAAKTIDLEVWLPGQNRYREISSISNTRDFQARRAKIRFKDQDGKNRLVHTLNGSALAVGRTLIAIMENFQQKDGSIKIPKALEKYL